MPPSRTAPPRWSFAVGTVLWALCVGLFVRLLIVVIAPVFGGRSALEWLARTPLGLVTGAIAVQLALLAIAQQRATLMPPLRAELLAGITQRPSRWVTATILVLGLAPLANFTGLLVAKATGANLEAMEAVGELVRQATLLEFVAVALVLTLLPALVEESIFRGLVQKSLDHLPPILAIALSALSFGVFHLDLAQGVANCMLGLGFGYIAHTTGSLLGSMVAHGVYNLVVLSSQRFVQAADPLEQVRFVELGVGLLIAFAAAQRLWLKRQVIARGSEASP
jgi:membrane protease YdiL (CAAX protease family)